MSAPRGLVEAARDRVDLIEGPGPVNIDAGKFFRQVCRVKQLGTARLLVLVGALGLLACDKIGRAHV